MSPVKRTKCPTCGNELIKNRNRRYCSPECRERGGVHVECGACGKPIRLYPSSFNNKRKHGRVYCSHSCRSQYYKGPNNTLWKGRYKNKAGYVVLRSELVPDEYKQMVRGDGRLLEHRLVMARALGRLLEDHEVVHHKNGIKDDNRPENLELHSAYEHSGITTSENKRIRDLERALEEAKAELNRLKGTR